MVFCQENGCRSGTGAELDPIRRPARAFRSNPGIRPGTGNCGSLDRPRKGAVAGPETLHGVRNFRVQVIDRRGFQLFRGLVSQPHERQGDIAAMKPGIGGGLAGAPAISRCPVDKAMLVRVVQGPGFLCRSRIFTSIGFLSVRNASADAPCLHQLLKILVAVSRRSHATRRRPGCLGYAMSRQYLQIRWAEIQKYRHCSITEFAIRFTVIAALSETERHDTLSAPGQVLHNSKCKNRATCLLFETMGAPLRA